ncbi:jg2010 [Pararge aegeria aegeria]|uniref:Jg2010 protein n=1 Tax=Pararge aegeria aegeria TaxID=348720 RepID=A0A8S4S9J1_9NEOP|nr:jg2010 [Pararge aegeria aegeria]
MGRARRRRREACAVGWRVISLAAALRRRTGAAGAAGVAPAGCRRGARFARWAPSPVRPAGRSDALQVRGGQSARAASRSTPPHPPDIKTTILCRSNLIPCRASREMDLDVRNVH